MDSYASDHTSSGSEEIHTDERFVLTRPVKRSKPASKRKTTYTVRRDEIQLLEDEVTRLRARLREYETNMPINKSGLRDALVVNAGLAHAVEQSTLSLAGTQSLLSAHTLAMMRATGHVPLKDYVHLPADSNQRQAVLAGMYEWKLRAAAQFMAERTRFLDLSVAHRQSEQFEKPDGAVTLDVTPFTQGHSIRQVYSALMSFFTNQEISLSEQLGFLTIRESDQLEEFKFSEARFLSSFPGGLEVESNIVSFATCVDATPDSPGYAVAAVDFVDQDELHPYRPQVCARKELTGAITLHEVASPDNTKPTITMVRWSFVRLLQPEFPISGVAASAVQSSIAEWCAYVPKTMKEQLAVTPPAP